MEGPATLGADQLISVSTSRDATGTITTSVDGVQQFSIADTNSFGVFDQPNAIIWFFEDDTASNSGEVSSGFVDHIQIFGPTQSVPEPTSLMLLGLGSLGILARRLTSRRS